MLRWAQGRAGQAGSDVEHRFPRWSDWLDGSIHPTFHQVQDLARLTHVPFGAFFAPEPPVVELPIPDFRRRRGAPLAEPSQDLLQVLYASQERQDWFRDYSVRHGLDPVGFIGSGRDLTPTEAAARIVDQLDFDVERRGRIRIDGGARKYLFGTLEALGVIVNASSMVGNNTHRLLDPDEFSGFALSDEIAPLIFVNAAETQAAQTFTILHEVAHLWRGDTGVGLDSAAGAHGLDLERWANQVAAEALVPLTDLVARFRPARGDALTTELDRLAKIYLASTLVILLQARAARLLPDEGFDGLYETEVIRLRDLRDRSRSNDGGNFYQVQHYRIGRRLPRALISDAYAGGTSLSDALRLLSFKQVKQLDTYAEELGVT